MNPIDVSASSAMMNVLVVDDESNIRKTMTMFFELRHHRVVTVPNADEALVEASRQRFDLAFVDLRLGVESGLDLLSLLLSESPWLKIVVITAYASIDTAVEAMKRGAADYLPKPFAPGQLKLVLERLASIRILEQRISHFQDELHRSEPDMTLVSANATMQRVVALARQVADSDAMVLLRGPSGTGKTVLARLMHTWSSRARRPFSVVACPALNPELLESELFGHVRGAFTGAVRDNPGRIAASEGGTLFLDEIGDLPPSIQPKLLRFIQDRQYERVGDYRTRTSDIRIIAATNADLESAVRNGRFREDLYYRINVIQITLPSLAERAEDIDALAMNLLTFFNAQNHKTIQGFSAGVLRILHGYAWPGNIRELRNVIERAVILCTAQVIVEELLPATLNSPERQQERIGDRIKLEELELLHIRRVLANTATLQEASDILGIDKATLWRKRKQLGL